jgi:uncharacterized membrane protein YkoI
MSKRPNNAKLAAAGLLAVIAVGGGASIAAAAGPGSSTASAGQQQTGGAQEAADPAFTGTVPAPADTAESDGQETPGGDARELAALQELATVSQRQAEQAALGAVPGSVGETRLDAENGFVVYSVEINGTDGTVTEVVVDAGNATVLTQQAQDAGDPADQPGQAGDQQD